MTMADEDTDKLQALLRDDIHSETSKIAWSELQRFFAAGKAIHIAIDLDLVEVALQFANDNSTLVAEWMANGKISTVSDEQARHWYDTDASVWAVVVKPWVLVQDIEEKRIEH